MKTQGELYSSFHLEKERIEQQLFQTQAELEKTKWLLVESKSLQKAASISDRDILHKELEIKLREITEIRCEFAEQKSQQSLTLSALKDRDNQIENLQLLRKQLENDLKNSFRLN